MAEFQEVMKHMIRMCEAMREHCPICDLGGGCPNGLKLADIDAVDIESRVMRWAAENPEPVYPTWGEWFVSEGLLPEKWDDLTSAYMNVGCVPNLVHSPIPAHFALKLGLKPKEG